MSEGVEVGLPLYQSEVASPNFGALKASRKRKRVPHRWVELLALHLAGKGFKEIHDLTGVSQAAFYRILAREEMVMMRQQMLAQTQQEFEALYQKVVDNIRTQLHSTDPQIQLAAQTQFFKATGKFAPKVSEDGEKITAEDLVTKLLNQQINIQVNIGGKQDDQ